MKAINPFLILEIDESASRQEIDQAYKRMVRECHPDRFGTASPEEQKAAAARMAEINYAYEVLTNPETAAAHKQRFDRVRAKGIHVEPAPQRPPDSTPTSTPRSGATPVSEEPPAYRRRAPAEFTVGNRKGGEPWTAGKKRGWLRRR